MISPNAAVSPNISGKKNNGNASELPPLLDLGASESIAKMATPIEP